MRGPRRTSRRAAATGGRGITRLLVEGGATRACRFPGRAGFADRLEIFSAPIHRWATVASGRRSPAGDARRSARFARTGRRQSRTRCAGKLRGAEPKSVACSRESSPTSGEVRHVEKRGDTHVVIATHYDVGSVDMGASIACSGVCMTVVDKGNAQGPLVRGHRLGRDAVEDDAGRLESGRRRSISNGRCAWATNWAAISSPAMSMASAEIVGVAPEGESTRMTFEAPPALARVHRAQGLGRAGRRVADGE